MAEYTRDDPSPRFKEIVSLYKTLHKDGVEAQDIPAEETFDGRSLAPHLNHIGAMIKAHGARTLLDYGSGKGSLYETATSQQSDGTQIQGLKAIWGLDETTCYDPGYEPYSNIPTGTFDAVICTDVLEHVPEEDISWVLDELFSYANKFMFCTIAMYPAMKILPNGENAHITLKDPGWWANKLEEASVRCNHEIIYSAVLLFNSYNWRRLYLESVNT